MNSSLLTRVLGAVAIVIAIGGVVYGMSSARKSQELEKKLEELKNNPQQATQDEVKQLVEETGALIELPEGENPTVASITDREKLKDVPFFAKAENGDKVLIYVNARKAYLYRPSTQKLIEVATVNLTPRADQSFAAKIALRNSTDVAGLTKRIEDDLKRVLPNAQVVTRDNAKAAVESTIVVDLTGSRKADAERLATIVGATVGELPKGEAKPAGADFLILLGKDKAAGAGSPSPSPTASPGSSPSPSPSPSPTPKP